MTCGKVWILPQLTCTSNTEHSGFPGEEEPQAITNANPESKKSCPFTTADFQKHTEAATTMETFIFTAEYQVAVAGCVFLLISILLSGLTWQRRW
ncbi:PREDICTED: interleukin-2 receptor subunit alpha isoform X2 [Galeopterus variegatus]|uniref:Interleukin-2 receptor subunit alpha isoform X2 n=1 Tax=Galeopterus variegatus TaxID=482537 RepID=A0ABM0QGZ1_GALVR|nr:PREDICTED: interleukin-2 receptor subunit alpha isoform X2 [Galeopterus variegatus]